MKTRFLYGVNEAVHHRQTDGQFFGFTPTEMLHIPSQISFLRVTKNCLPNTLITIKSKYHLRIRAVQERLDFFQVTLQVGCLYADFTWLCRAATPPPKPFPPVTTGPMVISSLTIKEHISMIGCK